MKNLSILLFGFFLAMFLVGCHYEEIPIECNDPANPNCDNYDLCMDSSIPHCCENGNLSPCCDELPLPVDCIPPPYFLTYDKPLTGINCNTPLVEEVIELPNGKGYLLAGFCSDLSAPNLADRRGLLIHIDTNGVVQCQPQYSELGDDFFLSIAIQGEEIAATGHTRSTITGSDVYYLPTNTSGFCNGNGVSFADPLPNEDGWDQGNSVVFADNSSVVIAGKGSIYPSLWKLSIGTNTITDYKNYKETDFASAAPDMIPVTAGVFCDVDHHARKLVKTSDNSYIFTGLINTEQGTQTYSKSYLVKTEPNSLEVGTNGWIKTFDNDQALGLNTVGRDVAQVAGGSKYVLVGYAYNEDVPDQLSACGATEFDNYDYNGFVVLVDSDGGFLDKKFFDVSNGSKDFVNAVTTLLNNDDEIIVVGSVTSGGTEKLKLLHYKIVGNTLEVGDITFNIDDSPSGKKTEGIHLIPTADGGYFIIANVRSSTGSPESIRVIKTDPQGNS